MDQVVSFVSNYNDARLGGGDSFCDRLSSRYTVFLLSVFSMVLSTKQFVGDPISCWTPAHFTSAHDDYVNKQCWVKNTYYAPFDKDLPAKGEPKMVVGYYQWVGLILMTQSVFFYLPRPIWQLINRKSGVAVTTITDAAIECQTKRDFGAREQVIKYMAKYMGMFLREISRKTLMVRRCHFYYDHIYGNYLILLYVFVKCLYLGNAVLQLFLLNEFLGFEYNFDIYGAEIFRRLVTGQALATTHRFPRVTFCDFEVRVIGNVHRYTVQCSLPVNLFNEKIFIFIWFWYLFVAIATAVSLCIWIIRMILVNRQVAYIRTRLIAMDRIKVKRGRDKTIRSFVNRYLHRDGIFIIWMVSKNASDMIAAELICELWDDFRKNQRSVLHLSSTDQRIVDTLYDSDDSETQL